MSLTTSSALSIRTGGTPVPAPVRRGQTPAPAESFRARWQQHVDEAGTPPSLQQKPPASASDAQTTSSIGSDGKPPVIKIPLLAEGDTQEAVQDQAKPSQQLAPTEEVVPSIPHLSASAKAVHAKAKEAQETVSPAAEKLTDDLAVSQPRVPASDQPGVVTLSSQIVPVVSQERTTEPDKKLVTPSVGKKPVQVKMDHEPKTPMISGNQSGDDSDKKVANDLTTASVDRHGDSLPSSQTPSVQGGQNPLLTFADHVIPVGTTPASLPQHGSNLVSQEPARAPSHETSSAAQFSAAEPALLSASPGSLEFGVQSGTHGWVRVRAELDRETGSVSAVMLAPSAQTASSLDRQVPAMQAYLSGEQVALTFLTVTAQSVSDQSGLASTMQDQARQEAAQHPDAPPASQISAENFSGGEMDVLISRAYTGGWLNVLA